MPARAWVSGWRKLPHLKPEVVKLFDYPQQFAEDMGADGYGKDAMACVEKAKELLGLSDLRSPAPAIR